jgi:hypothetical protein
MSQECPHCGLFSPDSAGRCDCGYDFATRTLESSYLAKHIVQKHGGLDNMLHEAANSNIRAGVLILGSAIGIGLISYLASGNLSVAVGALLSSGALLNRGLNQRRIRELIKKRDRIHPNQAD